MKKIVALIIAMISFMAVVYSQGDKFWGDPHVQEKFRATALKDPSYAKLLSELDKLVSKATKSNTNAAAVKALLVSNKALLGKLYKTANLPATKTMGGTAKRNYIAPSQLVASSMISKLRKVPDQFVKVETPSYTSGWNWSNQGGYGNVYPDTSGSNYNTGKIIMTFTSGSSNLPTRLGQYFKGFKQSFTVPNNPEIIAAKITFEYSFFYTGWDTYGAQLGMDLVVEANDKITGPAYNALPEYDYSYFSSNHRWKHAATLYPLDTIDSDFGEFHAETNSSFMIEGYVTPGAVIDVKLGAGFAKNTRRGLNGSYHYAEFIVKKITIQYYKTAN